DGPASAGSLAFWVRWGYQNRLVASKHLVSPTHTLPWPYVTGAGLGSRSLATPQSLLRVSDERWKALILKLSRRSSSSSKKTSTSQRSLGTRTFVTRPEFSGSCTREAESSFLAAATLDVPNHARSLIARRAPEGARPAAAHATARENQAPTIRTNM